MERFFADSMRGWRGERCFRSNVEAGQEMADFASGGLAAEEGIILLGSEAQNLEARAELTKRGLDVAALVTDGQICFLGAEKLWDRICVDGRLDRRAFQDNMGFLVQALVARFGAVRAFVAIASSFPNLEQYWTELLDAQPRLRLLITEVKWERPAPAPVAGHEPLVDSEVESA